MSGPVPAPEARCSFGRRRVRLPRSQPAHPGRLGSAIKSVRPTAWTGPEEGFLAILGNTGQALSVPAVPPARARKLWL